MLNMLGMALNQHVELIPEEVPTLEESDLITRVSHDLNSNFVFALQSGSQNITEKLLGTQAKDVIHM